MAKYDSLRDHLLLVPAAQDEVTLTFAEVDRIVGGLPDSARRLRQWWANDSKVEAQAWRAAGWHVARLGVGFNAGQVRFHRGRVGGSRLARLKGDASTGVGHGRQAAFDELSSEDQSGEAASRISRIDEELAGLDMAAFHVARGTPYAELDDEGNVRVVEP